jgi:hypothetical protein
VVEIAHVVDLKHNRIVVVFRRRRRAVRLALPLGRGGRTSIARDLVSTRLEPCVRLHGGRKRRRALGIVRRDELEELALDVVRGRVLALELLVIANLEELLQAPACEVELASAPPFPWSYLNVQIAVAEDLLLVAEDRVGEGGVEWLDGRAVRAHEKRVIFLGAHWVSWAAGALTKLELEGLVRV